MLPCWFMFSPPLSSSSCSGCSNSDFCLHSYITMISLDFKNKLVLVTGGGRGIGLEITRAIAEGEKLATIRNPGNLTRVAPYPSSWRGSGYHIHVKGLLRAGRIPRSGIFSQGESVQV